jgi:uncharacterized protein (DUF2147 family)
LKVKEFRVTFILKAAVATVAVTAWASTASAADPKCNWLVQDKRAVIQVTNCGSALCGWTLNTVNVPGKPMKVERVNVLQNMAPAGQVWKGRAFNPQDSQSYEAEMAMQGDNILLVKGCGMGFCKQEVWTRTKAQPKAAPPRVRQGG